MFLTFIIFSALYQQSLLYKYYCTTRISCPCLIFACLHHGIDIIQLSTTYYFPLMLTRRIIHLCSSLLASAHIQNESCSFPGSGAVQPVRPVASCAPPFASLLPWVCHQWRWKRVDATHQSDQTVQASWMRPVMWLWVRQDCFVNISTTTDWICAKFGLRWLWISNFWILCPLSNLNHELSTFNYKYVNHKFQGNKKALLVLTGGNSIT